MTYFDKVHGNFEQTMEAMRKHYCSFSSQKFELQIDPSAYNADDLPEEAKNETKKFQIKTDKFTSNEQTSADNNTTKILDSEINYEEFEKIMNQNRTEAKKEATENLDKYYDKMLEIGKKNPKAQSSIIILTKSVSDFFNGLVKNIINFCEVLVEKITAWLTDAYNHISSFFTNAFGSIGSFFGGFFSLVPVQDNLAGIENKVLLQK